MKEIFTFWILPKMSKNFIIMNFIKMIPFKKLKTVIIFFHFLVILSVCGFLLHQQLKVIANSVVFYKFLCHISKGVPPQ